jgi:hypothetical protein
MKPSHMQTIKDEIVRHEKAVHTFARKPVSNFYQTEEAKADAECRKVRAETRARFAQGSDVQRAAELAARMCHGVDYIVMNCGVTRDEAELLVLGRMTAKNTPLPSPEKQKKKKVEKRVLKSRAQALAEARGLLDVAQELISGVE